jgi:hypothetical protein
MNTINFGGAFDASMNSYFMFFDIAPNPGPCFNNQYNASLLNNTLGWIMGFRELNLQIYSTGNTGDAVINLLGPKYLILVIDDFNQNHLNNGLITITETSKTLPLPSYYDRSNTNKICIDALSSVTYGTGGINVNYDVVLDKMTNEATYPQVMTSFPRTLTQSQLYTINEIIKNRKTTSANYRSKAPCNSDTFALIPIKYGGLNTGDLYCDFSGSLQDNKRVYFGPVNIDRMRIKLLDDKGNVLNLNGHDWCFTLISENLYQY